MVQQYCKIKKDKTIWFYEKKTNEWLKFGVIDKFGIEFNITKKFIYGDAQIEEIIPNPPLEFYIELGEQLNNKKGKLKKYDVKVKAVYPLDIYNIKAKDAQDAITIAFKNFRKGDFKFQVEELKE